MIWNLKIYPASLKASQPFCFIVWKLIFKPIALIDKSKINSDKSDINLIIDDGNISRVEIIEKNIKPIINKGILIFCWTCSLFIFLLIFELK